MKLWRVISCVAVCAVGIPTVWYTYNTYGTRAAAGEMTGDYVWAYAGTSMAEPVEDFNTLYIQRLTEDIWEPIDMGYASDMLIPESLDVFERPLTEEEQEAQGNGTGTFISGNGTVQYSSGSSTTTTSVDRVPKAPTSSSGAPSGQWCVYVGASTGGVPAFDAGLFPSGTASVCKQIYDAVVNGRQGEGHFSDIKTLNKVCNVFTQTYGISVGLIAEGSKECIGYFPALSGNRVSSASYAEKIVRQLFPNGATANDVVQGVARWLCSNTVYNINLASANDIFTRGMGNCNAYASAFKQMVNAMGIQCDIVAGSAYGVGGWGPHAWNLVYINGAGYYVDVCYADTGANWNYILSTSIWRDHSSGVVDNAYFQ